MKIKHIEPIAVRLPMIKPVKMSFEEIRAADNTLVRVETDDGIGGWGEAASAPTMTGETSESMVAAIRYLAPLLEGMPADDVAGVMKRADCYLYGNRAAKSAIEMALYDALGHAAGVPVYDLIGSKRRSRIAALRLLGTGSAAGDVEEAISKKAEGYVAFKVKVGVADPLSDAQRTRAVCEALGNGGILTCADANQGWSAADAITYVRAIADTTIQFFEQPVAGEDLEGMAQVARASRVKIGCDEGLHRMSDLQRHHAAGAAHGGSLKTIKLGGMKAVYDAARLCEVLGMHVNLAGKMGESGIATAAVLQLAASVPALDWGVSLTNQYLADDVLVRPITFAHGHAEVPAGPGLGVEVDEMKVRRYAREH